MSYEERGKKASQFCQLRAVEIKLQNVKLILQYFCSIFSQCLLLLRKLLRHRQTFGWWSLSLASSVEVKITQNNKYLTPSYFLEQFCFGLPFLLRPLQKVCDHPHCLISETGWAAPRRRQLINSQSKLQGVWQDVLYPGSLQIGSLLK